MSTLALQVEDALNRFDALERAELEAVVTRTIQRIARQKAASAQFPEKSVASSAPPVDSPTQETPEENYYRRLRACAGSVPGLPEDFEESPWETDRDAL
jgi:hypothetical protein